MAPQRSNQDELRITVASAEAAGIVFNLSQSDNNLDFVAFTNRQSFDGLT